MDHGKFENRLNRADHSKLLRFSVDLAGSGASPWREEP